MTQLAEVEAWRTEARDLAAQGRPDEAVERYRAYFAASRDVPALYGVRLSFALAEWAGLAAVHPPARQALIDARREAADRLLAPDGTPGAVGGPPARPGADAPTAGDSFAEVASISEALGEPRFPVELFCVLDARRPDVAAACAIGAQRLLVRAGRYDLARQYLGDPPAKVARLAEVLQFRLTRPAHGLSEEGVQARHREAVRDYAERVREVLVVLDRSGEPDLAERTRRRAVEGVAWGHIRDEVARALAGEPDTPG